jgi:hypothetical protein
VRHRSYLLHRKQIFARPEYSSVVACATFSTRTITRRGLQDHPNEELYDKAVRMLETYFEVEEGEDQNLAPGVTAGGVYAFGAPTGIAPQPATAVPPTAAGAGAPGLFNFAPADGGAAPGQPMFNFAPQ